MRQGSSEADSAAQRSLQGNSDQEVVLSVSPSKTEALSLPFLSDLCVKWFLKSCWSFAA